MLVLKNEAQIVPFPPFNFTTWDKAATKSPNRGEGASSLDELLQEPLTGKEVFASP